MSYDVEPGDDPTEVTKLNAHFMGVQSFADYLGISSAEVSNVTLDKRKPSRILLGALQCKNLIPLPPPRYRIEARLESQEQHDTLMRGVEKMGFKGWYDFVRILANSWLKEEQIASETRMVVVGGSCEGSDIEGDCICYRRHGQEIRLGHDPIPPYHDGCSCYMIPVYPLYGFVGVIAMKEQAER
jgi:hypothetical protein